MSCDLYFLLYIKKKQKVEDRNRTSRTDKRIFAVWFSKNVFNLKNIDFSLLVKSFGAQMYFEWKLFNSQNYFQLNYFEITK